jgi:hypothetical protein
MTNGKNEDKIISMMLEETFNSTGSEAVSKRSKELLMHFVEASSSEIVTEEGGDDFLYNYLNRQNLFFLSGNFVEQTNCLRFSFGHEVYDIPKNMNSLDFFSEELESKTNGLLLLNDVNDSDKLSEVFSSLCGYESDLIFVNTSYGVYMVLCPKNDSAVFSWLSNYLGIKNTETKLKVA